MEILAQNPTEKFLLLQSLESYLQKTGLSPARSKRFHAAGDIRRTGPAGMGTGPARDEGPVGPDLAAVSKTETLWDDHLLRHKFFPRLIELATAGGLLALVRTVFSGYGPALIGAITLVLRVYMTVVGALMIGALLNTVNDIYESKPQSRRKSIRGYIQTAKIVVWIIAGILDRLDPDRPRSDGPAARTGSFGGAGVARVQRHDFGLRRIDPALGSGHDKARRLDRDAVERSGRGRQRNQR